MIFWILDHCENAEIGGWGHSKPSNERFLELDLVQVCIEFGCRNPLILMVDYLPLPIFSSGKHVRPDHNQKLLQTEVLKGLGLLQ
ncbi:MAG: hypothetical protein ABI557_16460 [Aureliella sp.]